MHRQQLEHIIRAAAGITGATEFVIVGSQSVLGQFPQAPDELLISIEADVFSLRDPADNDLIDGSIGEGSPFHQTFGYYAHGVSQETAVLPAGWRELSCRCTTKTLVEAPASVWKFMTWQFLNWWRDGKKMSISWVVCYAIVWCRCRSSGSGWQKP